MPPSGAFPYRRLSSWLQERFGERVRRVCIHCGFTCPNRDGSIGRGGCAYCNPTVLAPEGYEAGQPVAEQLARGMAAAGRSRRARRFIAYFQDGCATYAPVERLATLYSPALEADEVAAIAVSTRPDCLPPDVLALLAEMRRAKELWVELGLQVADDGLLAGLGRGHTVQAFADSVESCRRHGIPVCAHVIIGLPDARPEHELATADLLAALGVWGVKLHAFHVLRGTPMEARMRVGELELLRLEEHADRVAAFLEREPPEMVVHRVSASSPGELLLAPAWTRERARVIAEVVAAFARRGSAQGSARIG